MYREIYKKHNIRVECIVVQYCCSAATLLALECDSVKLNNNAKRLNNRIIAVRKLIRVEIHKTF